MIRNFRDLSIYKNKEGKHLRSGCFLRSAALCELNDEEIGKLLDYRKPLTVIDLRTDTEAKEKPDFLFDIYHHVPIIKDEKAGISHDKKSEERMKGEIPDMQKLYADFIKEDYSVEGIKKALAIICNPERKGTVLWHCTEGKDRCGIVSALFLKLMGFDDQVIMKDYLKSAKSTRKRALKYYLLITVFVRDQEMARAVWNAYAVKPAYLKAAFDAIDERYGSFEAFFQAIGIDEDVKKRMQRKYLR